ncbi:MAG: dienelactone hydrolase family protein [SAR324 cluster bacterium]|nr:dienelactone hydrolase family protein [SAR324 cluster bacterium]
MGEMIQFSGPDGNSVPGYLATPAAGDGAPGIVVVQEWWGLNEQIKSMGDRFAAEGYRTLVPDLYRGRVTQDPDEANHMMSGLDWAGATHQDIRGAVQYLKSAGQKAAVMGFCMGGALVIMAGVHVPELDAGVCFYGIPPKEAADPQKIGIPLQAHFANTDDWCTPDAVNALESDLQAGGVNHELYRYDAQHGFVNDTRSDVYDATAASESIERSLTFLKANL